MANETISMTQQDLERLGEKLDATDLGEDDRKLLIAAFAMAGRAISNEADSDVSGYSLQGPSGMSSFTGAPLSSGLNTGFQSSLSTGLRKDFTNRAIIISVGF